MYSYEEKIKAVKLLIKYEKCYAQVMRELGYPDRKSLMAWYKQYLRWYSEKRIKISLRGMSPLAYRKSLGLIT